MTLFVKMPVMLHGLDAIFACRDNRDRALPLNMLTKGVGIISLISQERLECKTAYTMNSLSII